MGRNVQQRLTLQLDVEGATAKRVLAAIGDEGVKAATEAEEAFEDLDDDLRKIGRRGKKTADGLSKAWGGFGRFLRSSLKPALAGILVSLLSFAALGNVTRQAQEFQIALGEVATILPDTQVGVLNLRDAVLELATAQGQNERVVAKGLYQVISAGVSDAAEALEVLEVSSRLAVAGVAQTNETVDLLTTAMNAFGLGVDRAEQLADVFFATVREGKTTISELAGSIGGALPGANALGVSIEEVTAGLAALTKQGFNTSEASTRLASLWKALLVRGGELDKLFRERLGKSYDINTVKGEGLFRVLQDIRGALIDDSEALEILGARQEAFQALLGLTGDKARLFAGALNATTQAGGTLAKVYDRIAGTDGFKVLRTTNAIRIAFLDLGDSILATVASSVESLGGVEAVQQAFQNLATGLEPVITGLIREVVTLADDFDLVADNVELSALKARRFALELEGILNLGGQVSGFIRDAFDQGAGERRAFTEDLLRDFTAGREDVTAGFGSAGALGLFDLSGFSSELRAASDELQDLLKLQDALIGRVERTQDARTGPLDTLLKSEEELQRLMRLELDDTLSLQALEKDLVPVRERFLELARQELEVLESAGRLGDEAEERRKAELADLAEKIRLLEVARSKGGGGAPGAGAAGAGGAGLLSLLDPKALEESRRLLAEGVVGALQEQRAIVLALQGDLAGAAAEYSGLAEAARMANQEAATGIADMLAGVRRLFADSSAAQQQSSDQVLAFRTLMVGLQGQVAETDRERFAVLQEQLALQRESILLKAQELNLNDQQLVQLEKLLEAARLSALGGFEPGGGDPTVEGVSEFDRISAQLELRQQEANTISAVAAARREEIQAAKDSGKVTAEEARALDSLVGQWQNNERELNRQAAAQQRVEQAVQGTTNAMAYGLESALVSIASGSKSASAAFSDFARALVLDLIKMAVRLAVTNTLLAIFDGLTGQYDKIAAGVAGAAAIASGVATANNNGQAVEFANGGVIAGGFQAFANGGVVTSPTLGLIGEAGQNEAVVPLPDGRSIPVRINQDGMQGAMTNVTINLQVIDTQTGAEFLVRNRETIGGMIAQEVQRNGAATRAVRRVSGSRGGGL